jgi:hypothetical protein
VFEHCSCRFDLVLWWAIVVDGYHFIEQDSVVACIGIGYRAAAIT